MANRIGLYLRLIRVHHWSKNLLLFVPLFLSGHMSINSFLLVSYGFLCFCITSSLGYIINDWIDKKKDLNHPFKKSRPFAAEDISLNEAFVLWAVLFFLLLFMLFLFKLPQAFMFYLFLYMALSISYSLYLKDIILLDIFIISIGYIMRVMAGGAIACIKVSAWLFMSIFFLSMLISIAKRKSELILLKEDAPEHRKNLLIYKEDDLSRMLWIMACISLVVYTIYCIEKEDSFIFSIIPATYGIMRFCILAEQGRTLDPVILFSKDIQLIITGAIFLAFLSIKLYF